MNFSSETSIFHFPFNYGDEQDHHEVERASKRALERINLLYEEIMSPRDIHFDELNLIDNRLYDEQSKDSPKNQKHYLKTCCSTLQELCMKCENYVSRCSSCNTCSCVTSNVLKQKLKERSDNAERSSHQTSCKSSMNSTVKCTKPEPFSFINKDNEWLKARERKIAKIKEDLNSKIEAELKIKVHTKPVPKSTHLPLYNQMVQDEEKRKADRKGKCVEILNNTRPFELHYKCDEKGKSNYDLTTENNSNFKAKPVPKHILSNKVSEKMKNREIVRKMLGFERAQQLKDLSSSPFTQRTVPRSRSMIDMYSFTKTNNKDYSKKNISEITNRLYAKKCNETMNSWNEKVRQVDTAKNLPQDNILHKNINKDKAADPMPFLYFPVRMSNAALLRDKLIRENISARKARENKTQVTEELTKKKMNRVMVLKLRSLIPVSAREKEIGDKVKNFREWQIKRQEEYDKELEEIMMRVAEQSLLLERISKATKMVPEKNIHKYIDDESDSNVSAPDTVAVKDSELNSSASELVNIEDTESNSPASEASESKQDKSKESTLASEASDSELNDDL